MRIRTFFGLLLCVTITFCLFSTPSANAASAEEEALQVMSNWVKALNTLDYELMKSLYWKSPKASGFGPSKGDAFLTQGWEAIMKGFESFPSLPAGIYSVASHHAQATMLGDNVAVLTQYFIGVYTDPNTKAQSTGQIRQTFVIQKIDGRWVIVHDHGSVLPAE